MATEEGTTQAIFPEGGLSLDGRVGAAKMGLLSYILQDFGPDHRDVVFVPVGIGYDRVLEDRLLVEGLAAEPGDRVQYWQAVGEFRQGVGGVWRPERRQRGRDRCRRTVSDGRRRADSRGQRRLRPQPPSTLRCAI